MEVLISQLKVKIWVNGKEGGTVEGVGAQFGALFPSQVEKAVKWPVVVSKPLNACNKSSSQVCFAFDFVYLKHFLYN